MYLNRISTYVSRHCQSLMHFINDRKIWHVTLDIGLNKSKQQSMLLRLVAGECIDARVDWRCRGQRKIISRTHSYVSVEQLGTLGYRMWR